MRGLVITVVLMLMVTAYGAGSQIATPKNSLKETSFLGRWHLKFTLLGGSEKNLVLASRGKGLGSFELLDTGPDNKSVPTAQPAIWSKTLDNVSIAGDVELPIGTCCRETGTLIFKGKFVSDSSISGKLIFVTNTDDEESPFKLRSTIGTFTATRLPND